MPHTHTHTHPFNGPFSRTTRVGRYQKGKTNLDFTEARDSEWQWHQMGICKSAPRSRQITMPAPHHSVFLQAGCPSCRPTNSVKALKANVKALKALGVPHVCWKTFVRCCHKNAAAKTYSQDILTAIAVDAVKCSVLTSMTVKMSWPSTSFSTLILHVSATGIKDDSTNLCCKEHWQTLWSQPRLQCTANTWSMTRRWEQH